MASAQRILDKSAELALFTAERDARIQANREVPPYLTACILKLERQIEDMSRQDDNNEGEPVAWPWYAWALIGGGALGLYYIVHSVRTFWG